MKTAPDTAELIPQSIAERPRSRSYERTSASHVLCCQSEPDGSIARWTEVDVYLSGSFDN